MKSSRKVLQSRRKTPDQQEVNALVVLAKQGRYLELEALAKGLIRRLPQLGFGWKALGLALKGQGLIGESLGPLQKAAELLPGDAEAHSNLGVTFKELGRLPEAEASYRQALALKPDFAEAHNNLGNTLRDQGRLSEAEASYRRALALKPGFAEAHKNLGNTLLAQGRLPEAKACYRQALALKPDFIEAHNNLGNTLRDQGRLPEAEASYRRALALNPDLAEVQSNLGIVLRDQGRVEEAAAYFRRAIALAPEQVAYRCNYGELLRRLPLSHDNEPLVEDLIRAVGEAWTRPVNLVATVAGLLCRDPELAPGNAVFTGEALERLAANRLFTTFLAQALAADPFLESLVARVRLSLLAGLASAQGLPDNPLIRRLAATVAHQSFNNEYALFEPGEETGQVEIVQAALAAQLAGNGPVCEVPVLVLAAYRPLGRTALAEPLRRRRWSPELEAVILRQIVEPEEEAHLRDSIPRLTAIDDEISQEVRGQYEENPYPRWIGHQLLPPARRAEAVIGAAFPHAEVAALRNAATTDILIAGCGTGQHPCQSARRYSHSSVLAIDLSLASLSYAVRKAREQRIDNLTFAQADILALGSLERRFHLIESVGVLHHMREPLLGWSVLVSLLLSGGFMKIGLYGELSRAGVVAARDFIRRKQYPPTPAGIRAFRKAILDMPDGEPAKLIMRNPDFYSASACRDLVFHVQEHRYFLRDIQAAITQLGLQFIGFDPAAIGADVRQRYASLFPDDPTMTNLDHWQVIESETPHRLPFVFWVQKIVRF